MAVTVGAPSWWGQWGPLVTMYAAEFGVPLNIGAAVIQQESGGNPNAQSTFTLPNGVVGHANGLMQIVGGPFDPSQNISQGMQQLASDLNQFGTTLGLAAYNAGAFNVSNYGSNILNPAYLIKDGWSVSDANQVSAYVGKVTGLANAFANVLGPTVPVIPATPVIPGLPVLPLPSAPTSSNPSVPGQATFPFGGVPTQPYATTTTPALAPIPAPAPTGKFFGIPDAYNAIGNTFANAVFAIERFFFIGVGLVLIAIGTWLLVKSEDKNGSSSPA